MYNSGFRSKTRTPDGVGTVASQVSFVQKSDPTPSITSWSIQGSDDRALDPAGGQTVVVAGAGFTSGMTVTVGVTAIGSVTIVSSTQATFTAPAKAAGNYTLTMANSNGQAAILVPGLAYSTLVTWTTPAGSIGDTVETTAFTESVVATADSSITYALASGSLPTGATLNANGTITGTAVSTDSPTTYSFSIVATDEELQDSTQSFTITVNPDSVTWVSPANGTSYSLTGNQAMSNVTLSATAASGSGITYSANALPTGVSLTGNVIYGTPTVAETVSTLLTATANTTARYSTETITWVVSLGDTYWPYVSLLLNGATPTTTFINDASLNNNALTIVGDTKPNLFTPYEAGYYSNYFDGTGDYLTVPANAGFDFGTGDYTIEGWIYSASTSWTLYATGGSGASDQFSCDAGTLYWAYGLFSGVTNFFTSADLNKWTHVAASRSSGTTRIFKNGVVMATSATLTAIGSSVNTLQIGRRSDGFYYTTGYMSNIRVVKGTSLYSAAFTPPSSPLTAVANTSLLTCQSNQLIDTSIYNFAITKNGDTAVSPAIPFVTPTTSTYNTLYSVYNTGASGYVDAPLSSAFTMGTGDYTVECWFYIPSSLTLDSVAQYVFDQRSVGGSGSGLYCYVDGTATGFSAAGTASSPVLPSLLDAWTHIACTRRSGTAYLYVNGVQVDSGASATDYTTDNAFRIGSNNSGTATRHFRGYISNLRVVKGQALYTGTFTPPTATLTANSVGTSGANVAASITGSVALLCHQNNTLIDNSPNNFTLTSTGTKTQPAPQSPFTMTTSNTTVTSLGSAYFDGANEVLTLPASQLAQIGTQDFTMEAWVYTTTIATGSAGVFDMWNGGQTSFLLRRSTATWQFYVNGGSNIASATVVANTWTHVAAVRNGSTVKLYINGISVGTPLTYSTAITNTAALGIGGTATTGNEAWNGYIADARIVVGTALYTANFLPPQAPLTPVTNTSLLTCQYNGGANNNGFVDQSSFNNIITRTGNPTQGTFSPYSPTGWSNYFNGSSTYYFPANTALNIGAGAFTIEGWVNIPTGTNNKQFVNGPVLIGAGGYSGSTIGALRYYDGITAVGSASYLIATGNWNHFAIVRENTSTNGFKMYVNGILVYVGTSTANPANADTYIGAVNTSTDLLTGYISNVRWVKGTAVYTTASTTVGTQVFTPSTTPLTAITNTTLLTAQSNRFIDNSPYNFTPTISSAPSTQAYSPFGGITSTPVSYSNYFDGTGDYLVAATGSSGSLGTGDFCAEAWIYPQNSAEMAIMTNLVSSGGGDTQWGLFINTGSNFIRFQGWFTVYTTGNAPSLNTWNHVVACRSGTTLSLFLNGTRLATTTTANDFSSTNDIRIGAYASGTSPFLGYISNARLVKGASVYDPTSATITVPTIPLTPVSGTSLLTCQSNTMVDNSPNYFAITAAGNTAPRPYNPFGTTNTSMVSYTPAVNGGSMYFDGTGDYLTVPNSKLWDQTIPYTVEMWIYPTSTNTNQVLYSQLSNPYNGIVWTGTGLIVDKAYVGTFITGSGSYALNQWIHVAMTYDGTTTRLFANGTLIGSASGTGGAGGGGAGLYIANYQNAGTYTYYGYMSDLKVTSGKALYTSNFYPGSAPLAPTTTIGATTYSAALLVNGTSGGIIDYHSTNDLETVGNTQLAPQDPYAGNYYSVYFDGTGDYLTVPNSTNFAFGTGDFTVEFWMRTIDGAGGIVAQTSSGWAIAFNGGSFYWQSVYNSTNLWNYSSVAVTDGKWHHVAFVRASGTTKLYYDGAQVASNADSTDYTVTSGVVNMGSHAGVGDYQGYLSNLRIIKGTALYTSAFTPSTSPLTTSSQSATPSQVSLLTLQSNKFIDNSTNNLAITTAGTPGVNSSNPFQQNTGKSLYFDGTADRVLTEAGPLNSLGSGDFTIEGWLYCSTLPTNARVLSQGTYTTGEYLWIMYSSGGADFTEATTARLTFPSGSFTAGSWIYFAIVRSGTGSNNLKAYVNGVSVASATSTYNYSATTSTYIGSNPNTGSQDFNGYIKDLRITKGVARYTTTFTPPTTPDQTK